MSLPVASPWFTCEVVGPDLIRFAEPHVYRWYRANIWHVRGRDLDLLIDTGTGVGSLRSALGALADRPILAIATHGHIDHAGGHYEFARRAIHRAEASALEGDEALNLSALFRAAEAPVTAHPREGWELSAYTVKAAPATRLLQEGDRVDLGDRRFTVIHLPGHSPGSIGLLDEVGGVLFTGDALYEGVLVDYLPHSDVEVYAETMAKLARLDVALVHGGHGPSFDRARLRVLVEDYLAGRRRQGCPAPPA